VGPLRTLFAFEALAGRDSGAGAGSLSNVIDGSDGDAPLCSFSLCHCCYTTTPLTVLGFAQFAHSPDPSNASLAHRRPATRSLKAPKALDTGACGLERPAPIPPILSPLASLALVRCAGVLDLCAPHHTSQPSLSPHHSLSNPTCFTRSLSGL